jgi:hypothetical protein
MMNVSVMTAEPAQVRFTSPTLVATAMKGTVITITPQNYFVNGYQLNGSKTVTNLGENGNGDLHYSISVDGSITAPGNAWTSQWESDRIRTWVEGQSTHEYLG